MGKLRLKEFGNLPTVSHKTNKWQKQVLNSGLADSKSNALSTVHKNPSQTSGLYCPPGLESSSQLTSQIGYITQVLGSPVTPSERSP